MTRTDRICATVGTDPSISQLFWASVGPAEQWPVLTQLTGWIADYNTQVPHSALGMRAPAEYRALVNSSSPGVQ